MSVKRVLDPAIKIELVDGTNTWITWVPIRGETTKNVLDALHDAESMMAKSLINDEGSVLAHLVAFRDFKESLGYA